MSRFRDREQTGANTIPITERRERNVLNGPSLLQPDYLTKAKPSNSESASGFGSFKPVNDLSRPPPSQPPPFNNAASEEKKRQAMETILAFNAQQAKKRQQESQHNSAPTGFPAITDGSNVTDTRVARRDQPNVTASEDSGQRKRKRKSRWGEDSGEKAFIPGMPTSLPAGLSKKQEEIYLLQLKIEDASRRLRMGDYSIATNPEDRSPSPEPIYSADGKRMNTREYRKRRELEETRHKDILQMQVLNPEYMTPPDYRPPQLRINDRVYIPVDENPAINFVGLLIGPRGNTLKQMELETGAKIIIRGKGSIKEGKIKNGGMPLPGENEPLHAYITGTSTEIVTKAVKKVHEVIKSGIERPERDNDLRKQQLRELAELNGTLRQGFDGGPDGPRCSNCGATDHKAWQCQDAPVVTNSIICMNCGGAGHIAKDCQMGRGGGDFQGGHPPYGGGFGGPPPRPNPPSLMDVGGDDGGPPGAPGGPQQNKMDDEYLSLMAELGEETPEKLVNNKSSNQGAPNPSFNRGGGFQQGFGPPNNFNNNSNRPPMMRHPHNMNNFQNRNGPAPPFRFQQGGGGQGHPQPNQWQQGGPHGGGPRFGGVGGWGNQQGGPPPPPPNWGGPPRPQFGGGGGYPPAGGGYPPMQQTSPYGIPSQGGGQPGGVLSNLMAGPPPPPPPSSS